MSIQDKKENFLSFFKKNAKDCVYVITVVILAIYTAFRSGSFFPAIIFMIAFIAAMLTAKFYISKKVYKYVFALVSFIPYIAVVEIYHMPYYYDIVTNKWSFLILCYLLLLEDYIFSILVGTFVAVNILMLTPGGIVTKSKIMGNANGVLNFSIFATLIYNLFGKLLRERNKFKVLSITDSLTKLATFAHTLDTAREMQKNGPISVLIADMDRFKQINDTYGHIAGNKVLIEVADIIKKETKDFEGIVGRLGGDEFIIVVRNDGSERVLGLGDRLFNVMRDKLFNVDPEIDPINLSFSIGQANSTSTHTDIEKLLHTADVNMYYNKYKNHRLNIFINKEKPVLPQEGYELLNVLAEKDMYTYVHSGYTAQYAAALAKEVGFSEKNVDALYTAGWLHDMGKILVSSDIVRKNSTLTEEEYMLIKNHVNYGLNVLKDMELPEETIHGIRYHHECWDGSGYPGNLKGENIPIEARILKIADSYSAMIIKRVYRKTFSVEEALKEMKKNKGKHFDPKLVDVFSELIRKRLEAA
ncbi:MAG: diguanylate cyclase [Clostridia bacterium]|nr:diguanylate cyclase [Clostridia bacterium]